MNKAELIKELSHRTGISQVKLAPVVDSQLEIIADAVVSGDKVSLKGFGVFEVKERKERPGYNIQTQERVLFPASKIMSFAPSPLLTDRIKKV